MFFTQDIVVFPINKCHSLLKFHILQRLLLITFRYCRQVILFSPYLYPVMALPDILQGTGCRACLS